ncbi:iron chaperone [Nocardioides sp. Iso805N]|uniref:iron chaperone n=1 Tax=Nocardioides sp. Iso805N TaxID=1283287 RepID=UPI00036536B4|nr:DUF1801 domain-containing protein [Nocardioides sp. Iso805N]
MTAAEPRAIEEYLAGLEPAKREPVERYYARAADLIEAVQVGRSYAMPCYLYRGKGLISVMATQQGLSVIPFSGSVTQQLRAAHADAALDLSEGSGSIRITLASPLPDALFDELIRLRAAEIDAKARR